MIQNLRLRALLVGVVAVASAGLAAAQPAPPVDARAAHAQARARIKADPNYAAVMRQRFSFPQDPLPADAAKLDALLAAGDEEAVIEAVTAGLHSPDGAKYLNWERRKVFEGGPLIAAVLYTRDLWGIAEVQSDAALRETALSMAIYARTLVEVDGLRCANPEAQPFRRQQLSEILEPVWRFGAKAPEDLRQRALMVGLNTELITAPVRKPDNLLCQGPVKNDLAEIIEGLDALGDKPAPLAKEQHHLGKTYLVPRAPAKFRPETEWLGRREEVRDRLPDVLAAIVRNG